MSVTIRELNTPEYYCLEGEETVNVKYTFENGYGASVIRNQMSYGHDEGLYELAVLHNDHICYDSGITRDVIGWLNEDGVDHFLQRIATLEPDRYCDHESKWKLYEDDEYL